MWEFVVKVDLKEYEHNIPDGKYSSCLMQYMQVRVTLQVAQAFVSLSLVIP